jgi:hypothetical protein
MSNKPKHIDLDEIDLDSLSTEDRIMVLRMKGEIGHGDYTRDRHKWLDKIPKEEMRRELLKMIEERKDKEN